MAILAKISTLGCNLRTKFSQISIFFFAEIQDYLEFSPIPKREFKLSSIQPRTDRSKLAKISDFSFKKTLRNLL